MRRAIVIDNYDSFTYNLVQYISEAFHCHPLVYRNDEIRYEDIDFGQADFVLLSPGPGHPANGGDFGVCRDLVLKPVVPTIGVCLGHQGIILHHGGTVAKIPNPAHGVANLIHHTGKDLFTGLPSPLSVIRYHSLHATPPLPDCFEVEAITESGIIMAVRHRTKPLWGVQFHPESLLTEHGRRIIRNIELLLPTKKHANRLAIPAAAEVRSTIPSHTWRLESQCHSISLSPEEVFECLFGGSVQSFWLDTHSPDKIKHRFSYMGDMRGPHSRAFECHEIDPWLASVEDAISARLDFDSSLPFEFKGGLVGYIGYEMREALGGRPPKHSPEEPKAILRFVDRFVVYDALLSQLHFCQLFGEGQTFNLGAWVSECLGSLERFQPKNSKETPACDLVAFTLKDDSESYSEKIRQCMQQIHDGESYEICLTTEIACEEMAASLPLYKTLRAINPTPYSAFLDHGTFSVLCTSPERFFKIQSDGMIETKPIKGTRPRSLDAGLDSKLREDLQKSRKDLAENLMVTDMLRNDLNRICRIGSVWSPQHMHIESYRSVHQLISTVRGSLKPGIRIRDLIQALFPGGSMTGAPKLRTLEIIDHIEDRPRGIYSGAIGYFSLDGNADFNIVIRTIVKNEKGMSIGVGGAVIALSNPEDEFQELLVKARASMRAIALHLTGRQDGYFITNQVDHHHILPH